MKRNVPISRIFLQKSVDCRYRQQECNMRTVQEIVDSMNPELRCAAVEAVAESRMIAATLAQIPSPSVLNGYTDKPLALVSLDDVSI